MLYKSGLAVAFCADVAIMASDASDEVALYTAEGSLFNQVAVEPIMSAEEVEAAMQTRTMQKRPGKGKPDQFALPSLNIDAPGEIKAWWMGPCIAVAIVTHLISLGTTMEACVSDGDCEAMVLAIGSAAKDALMGSLSPAGCVVKVLDFIHTMMTM